jgi:hypothetical protein
MRNVKNKVTDTVLFSRLTLITSSLGVFLVLLIVAGNALPESQPSSQSPPKASPKQALSKRTIQKTTADQRKEQPPPIINVLPPVKTEGQLSGFYNNLFTIELASFGIMIAGFLVFAQIGYQNFSYRQVRHLWLDPWLIGYLGVSTLTLMSSATGSLLLSLDHHDFIPQWNLHARGWFTLPWTAALHVFATVLSLALFLIMAWRALRFLQPVHLFATAAKEIQPNAVRLFLLKQYGIPKPYLPTVLPAIAPEELSKLISIVEEARLLENREQPASPHGDQQSEDEARLIRRGKQDSETVHREYEELKQAVQAASDPTEELTDLALRAVKNTDLRSLEEFKKYFLVLFVHCLEAFQSPNTRTWNPDGNLREYLTKHFVAVMDALLAVAARDRFRLAELKVLEMTSDAAKCLLDPRQQRNGLSDLFNFWKRIAHYALTNPNGRELFNLVIRQYEELGGLAFEKRDERVLDDIFRDIGWLGGQLLSTKGIETKPVMADDSYETESDQLFNALLSFCHEYGDKWPDAYPLIYFDALRVVVLRLVVIGAEDVENHKVEETTISCLSAFHFFAQAALRAGNQRGAALAAMRLKECYEKLHELTLEAGAKVAIELLASLGMAAATYVDRSERIDFLGKTLEGYVMELLEASPYQSTIRSEIHECLIRTHGSDEHKRAWQFVLNLGKRMQTNFGFMFDWQTGQLYPNDDPRRR